MTRRDSCPVRETIRPLPIIVLMSRGSGWSWLIVEQLRECGFLPITVDITGLRGNSGVSELPVDYALDHKRAPHTHRLRGIAASHGAMRGLCLYGGRQAVELALVKKTLPGFRYAVYVGGSDVLMPHRRRAHIRDRAAIRAVQFSLRSAELVLANGGHLAAAVMGFTGGQTNVVTWRHGIPESGVALRGAAERSGLSICAPRPWGAPYNNAQVVRGIEDFLNQHPSEGLQALFCGPRSTAVDRSMVARLASSSGSTNRIAMVDGYLHAERFRLFGDYTVVASLATSDGTPNAVLEAVVAGSFPVLSDIAANRSLVEEYGLIAELAEIGSGSSVCRALERVVERRTEWNEIARFNRALVKEDLSTSAAQAALCSLLRSHMVS